MQVLEKPQTLEWVRAVVLQRRFAAPIPSRSEISVGFHMPCRTLILLSSGRSGKTAHWISGGQCVYRE